MNALVNRIQSIEASLQTADLFASRQERFLLIGLPTLLALYGGFVAYREQTLLWLPFCTLLILSFVNWQLPLPTIVRMLLFTACITILLKLIMLTHPASLPVADFFVLSADRWLFGGELPTLILQSSLRQTSHIGGLDMFSAFIYIITYPLPILTGLYLWIWDKPSQFKLYLNTVTILFIMAGFIYLTFPVTPPWLSAVQGSIPPVERVVVQVINHSPWPILHRFHSTETEHTYGAIPSMHVGYAALNLCFFWLSRRKWLTTFSALLLISILFVVLYAGEHFFFDALLALLLVVIASSTNLFYTRRAH